MKKRLIVLTDISKGIENDDIASMVRLLLYSNVIDIEGLIACTSCWVKRGGTQREKGIILKIIDAYEKVKDNLDIHQSGFPSPSYLRNITCCGIPKYGQELGRGFGEEKLSENEGVKQIIQAVDKNDERPVWIALWGGANTLAQALWKVRETRTKEEMDIFLSKIRVHAISDQDAAGHWIRKEFNSKIFYICSPSPAKGAAYYCHATWPGISADRAQHGSEDGRKNKGFDGAEESFVSKNWLRKNIKNCGIYGKRYPLPRFIMEGDTPSYLGLIPNGLNDAEYPGYGGWGGRYEYYIPDEKYIGVRELYPLWTNASDTVTGIDGKEHCSPQATIWRWRKAFQHDFAARMDWTRSSVYDSANHSPVVKIAHSNIIQAKSGEKVLLSAAGSYDPDGDHLTYNWFVYREAGTYNGEITIHNTNSQDAYFYAPEVNEKCCIHIILEVTDDGSPSLAQYQRIVIQLGCLDRSIT